MKPLSPKITSYLSNNAITSPYKYGLNHDLTGGTLCNSRVDYKTGKGLSTTKEHVKNFRDYLDMKSKPAYRNVLEKPEKLREIIPKSTTFDHKRYISNDSADKEAPLY
jgi:hypothetical protein